VSLSVTLKEVAFGDFYGAESLVLLKARDHMCHRISRDTSASLTRHLALTPYLSSPSAMHEIRCVAEGEAHSRTSTRKSLI